jgi:hypothetical protein
MQNIRSLDDDPDAQNAAMKRINDDLAEFQNDIAPSGHSLKSYTSRMRACKEQFATLVSGISHLFCINVFSSVAIGVCLACT